MKLLLNSRSFFQLPHRNVDLVERKANNTRLLTLYCKDFQTINLLFPGAEDCAKVGASIENLSNIGMRAGLIV